MKSSIREGNDLSAWSDFEKWIQQSLVFLRGKRKQYNPPVYFSNCAAKVLGDIPSAFLNAVVKELRAVKPDCIPIASRVSPEA